MTLWHKLSVSLDLSSFATFWKTSVFLASIVLNWPQCLLSACKHARYLPTDQLLSVHMVMGLSFRIFPVFQITNSYFGILTSKQKEIFVIWSLFLENSTDHQTIFMNSLFLNFLWSFDEPLVNPSVTQFHLILHICSWVWSGHWIKREKNLKPLRRKWLEMGN